MKYKAVYEDGAASIYRRVDGTSIRRTTIEVGPFAQLTLDGMADRPTRVDMLALAVGFQAVAKERDQFRSDLEAVLAGEVGRPHAQAMHEARAIIAELNGAGELFFEAYDAGNAPDRDRDTKLRKALSNASSWLIRDLSAMRQRSKFIDQCPVKAKDEA